MSSVRDIAFVAYSCVTVSQVSKSRVLDVVHIDGEYLIIYKKHSYGRRSRSYEVLVLHIFTGLIF